MFLRLSNFAIFVNVGKGKRKKQIHPNPPFVKEGIKRQKHKNEILNRVQDDVLRQAQDDKVLEDVITVSASGFVKATPDKQDEQVIMSDAT
jgi:hypothetical protein